MIDIREDREAYNDESIDDIIWIRPKFNLADAMTKPVINNALLNTFNTGRLTRNYSPKLDLSRDLTHQSFTFHLSSLSSQLLSIMFSLSVNLKFNRS